MTYPDLFKHHKPLSGRDWLRRIPKEDRAAFIQIGLQEAGHGQRGGRALYIKKGRSHMSSIGRIGAIATNSKKLWSRLMQEELYRELGVTFDF
jgi:hypothetical protein